MQGTNRQHNEQNQVPEQNQKPSLRQAITMLPRVLMVEVLKRLAAAILVFILSIVMVAVSHDWMYCVGFLIAVLAAYLAFDIIWNFRDGKIQAYKMVVCKASLSKRHRDKVHVTLRQAEVKDLIGTDYETYKFDISASNRDRENITTDTLLNIYISETAPHSILAYEILGEV